MIMGSVGAFLVLESRGHATQRGAHIYATIDSIEGDRGNRDDARLEDRLTRLVRDVSGAPQGKTVVFSGASGVVDLARREKKVIETLLPGAPIRGFGGVTGHGMEAQFPLGLALAAISLDAKVALPAFDTEHEDKMDEAASHAVVTTVGYTRGEGVAALSAA
jgi:3-oxoacyl-[acyl-carrier-protein] synthase II